LTQTASQALAKTAETNATKLEAGADATAVDDVAVAVD
jgi:hypothetical protein